MCGIAGIVRLDAAPVDPARVDAMLDRLHHRGPDERGLWADSGAVLGHTRLSIIDTEGSHQPWDQPGSVTIYNGEIFNFQELRGTLPGTWSSHGDTEVMARLLEAPGPENLRAARGQFAVAQWDKRTRSLTLARDAMGVLPLFFWADGPEIVFASELDALLHGLVERPEIDREALSLYLGYRAVPAPRTLWSNVRKLEPGHVLTWTTGDSSYSIRDWREPSPEPDPDLTFETAVGTLRERLTDAVALTLVADVPVGAYLSGGLDSSLIVALAQRHTQEPLRTYCASFGDGENDESTWARQVATHLGTRHTDVLVDSRAFLDDWPHLSRIRGAPVSEPSDIGVHSLARAASRDVKVVLSGEGSDELFAGYPKHAWASSTRRAGLIPAPLRRAVGDGLVPHLPPAARRPAVALRALTERDEDSRIRAWFASFTPSERQRLTGLDAVEAPLNTPRHLDPLTRMLRHDQGSWLADNLLERGDRMTMSASVELRPPFLDRQVVELARRIPSHVHRHQGRSKAVVRQVAEDLLPPAIVARPKAGFPVPIAEWLRTDLRETLRDRLLDPGSFTAKNLNRPYVQTLVDRHQSGRSDESRGLWTLLSLEIWADLYA